MIENYLPKNKEQKIQLLKKVGKVLERGYLGTGVVKNLTGYFGVPKGLSDIRVVYDASKSLLNQSLWAPNFALPTIFTVLRGVSEGSRFGDGDFGEHFLNFFLDKRALQFTLFYMALLAKLLDLTSFLQLNSCSFFTGIVMVVPTLTTKHCKRLYKQSAQSCDTTVL